MRRGGEEVLGVKVVEGFAESEARPLQNDNGICGMLLRDWTFREYHGVTPGLGNSSVPAM